MAEAVQHHLGHGFLACTRLQRRLVIDRRGQAFDRLVPLGRAGVQHEGRGRRVEHMGVGDRPVDALGLGHRQVIEPEVGRAGDLQPLPAARPAPDPAHRRVRIVVGGDVQRAGPRVGHQGDQPLVGKVALGLIDHMVGARRHHLPGERGPQRHAARQHQHGRDRGFQDPVAQITRDRYSPGGARIAGGQARLPRAFRAPDLSPRRSLSGALPRKYGSLLTQTRK